VAPPLLPVGKYLGKERVRGGTEAAVAEQHPKNAHNLQNHEQRTQITQHLAAVLRHRPPAGLLQLGGETITRRAAS
jgi:RNA:NAD 2'-phosphotransferase (TPT1/KptA family)